MPAMLNGKKELSDQLMVAFRPTGDHPGSLHQKNKTKTERGREAGRQSGT